MESIVSTRTDDLSVGQHALHGRSAASWGAIIAGALVAAAASLILVALGAGLGLAEISPWQGHGATATAFAVTTAIWFVVTQWVAAALGGYIAGRLRTRWIGTHTHEVFFRDTAHGLVTWALATVLVAGVLAGSVSSLLGGGVHAASTVAAGATESAVAAGMAPTAGYNVDRLFRGAGDSATGTSEYRGEAARILATVATTDAVTPEDRSYLTALIAKTTGISHEEAQKRLDQAVTAASDAKQRAKEAADAARKAAAEAAIYTALSLLIGAFIASVSAALGGRVRDLHP